MRKHGQIVLINGVCGVGKTTVSRSLCKRLKDKNFIRLDGDEYVIKHRIKPPESMSMADVGLWHVGFLKQPLVELLKNHNVILSETFALPIEAEFLSELQKSGSKIMHFVLDAERMTVVQRTLADREHAYAKDWRLKTYVLNMLALRLNFPGAVHVATDGRTVDEIVLEIYDRIKKRL